MSMRQPRPSVPETRRVNFAAAAALNTEVKGVDALTTNGFLLIGMPGNVILRAILNKSATNVLGDIIFKRDGKEVRRIPSTLLDSTQQGPYFPGFPLTVSPGQIQVYFEQTAGTAAAQTLDLVFQHSLIQVIS